MLRAGEGILHSRTFKKIVLAECPNQHAVNVRSQSKQNARSYSPSRLLNCACAYSRLSFAMKLALILAGHTASHS